MALITLRQLLDHAAGQSCGQPVFNVNNMAVLRQKYLKPASSSSKGKQNAT